MNHKISIKEISDLTGVSVATVSRVINGKGRYSQATRDRVMDVVKRYNYQPNEMARALRTKRSRVVGLIVPDITNEFFANLILHLQVNFSEAGYSSIICNTDESVANEEKYLKMLKSQLVSGLICISGYSSSDPAENLKIPTVYIDRKTASQEGTGQHVLIESDNRTGGRLAAQLFIDQSCRAPAIISCNTLISSHGDRVECFCQRFQEAGFTANIPVKIAGKANFAQGYGLALTLLQEHPELDSLFCTTDGLALGAQEAALQLGYALPARLKIIGFDDISYAASARASLTTIRQSVEAMARMGTEALLNMMEGSQEVMRRFIVPVQLIRRFSA